jgi:hypothetical protein
MSRFLENVAIVNSAVRTLLAVTAVGGLGAAGWYGYATYNEKDLAIEKTAQQLADARMDIERKTALIQEKDRTIGTLEEDVARKKKEIERLETAMRLLKVDHRLARLTVLDQGPDPETGDVVSLVEFQELNDEGMPVDSPKQFRVPGDQVYVDAWVVKFEDKYIEQADIDRGTSLVLFRRIFGERQKPLDGFPLDAAGVRPAVYGQGAQMSELEKKIWGDFWSVSNDEARQSELGIRAAHGEAPSIRVQKGKAYRLELRASGGLTIELEGDAPPRKKPAA